MATQNIHLVQDVEQVTGYHDATGLPITKIVRVEVYHHGYEDADEHAETEDWCRELFDARVALEELPPEHRARAKAFLDAHDVDGAGEADWIRDAICLGGYSSLDELLSALRARHLPLTDLLPVYGGPEPTEHVGAWSWDERSVMIGTCRDDLRIVSREDFAEFGLRA